MLLTKFFRKSGILLKWRVMALLFLKGTKYLINNLILSLSLAVLIIALFMAYLFRSFRMILISLIPNLLPLIFTAGTMGFLGIPLKPSTILVFSIAFGISVDDTIHFLAKYRQEHHPQRKQSKSSGLCRTKRNGHQHVLHLYCAVFLGFPYLCLQSLVALLPWAA